MQVKCLPLIPCSCQSTIIPFHCIGYWQNLFYLSFYISFQFRSIYKPISGIHPVGNRSQGLPHVHAPGQDNACATLHSAQPLHLQETQGLTEASSNVIFQRIAILIHGDPDRTWCEIANIIMLYDISASVWILSGRQSAKEKDAGKWINGVSLPSKEWSVPLSMEEGNILHN